MTFTRYQMQAVFTVARVMVVADGDVQEVESVPFALFAASFGVDENDVEHFLNNPLDPQAAASIIMSMSTEQKKEVKDLLVAIMNADGVRHPNELKLLSVLSQVCGLPQ